MLASFLALVCLLQAAPDKKPEPPAIAGVVVNQKTGDPIKGAQVTLGAENGPGVRAQTDAAGRFRFAGLKAGRYTITAERSGFVAPGRRSQYGGSGERAISIDEDHGVEDLRVALMPHAVITGRVLDEDGSPMPNVTVEVLDYRYDRAGRRKLMNAGGARTNDLGEYRISGIRPGSYYLRAAPDDFGLMAIVGAEMPQASSNERYPPIYYPNAAGTEDASRVKVAAGQELSGMDLRPRKVHTVRVRGKVTGIPAGKESPVFVFIGLQPRLMVLSGMAGGDGALKPDSDGAFEIRGVAAGSYTLFAQAIDIMAPEAERTGYTAEQEIEVGDSDVDDVTVSLRPPVDVVGVVRFPGKPAEIMVSLLPMNEGGFMSGGGGMSPAKPKEDGTFSMLRVPAGRYSVAAGSMDGAWQVKAATVGGMDVLEKGIDLTAGPPSGKLEIVMARGTAQVEGNAKPGALIVLMRAGGPRGGPDDYRLRTVADQKGQFRVEHVLPGEYQAWALGDDVEDGAWLDADFRKAHAAEAVMVKVGENASEKVNLVR